MNKYWNKCIVCCLLLFVNTLTNINQYNFIVKRYHMINFHSFKRAIAPESNLRSANTLFCTINSNSPLCLIFRFCSSRRGETSVICCGAADEGRQFVLLLHELQNEVKKQPWSGIIQSGLVSFLQTQILSPQFTGGLQERRWEWGWITQFAEHL